MFGVYKRRVKKRTVSFHSLIHHISISIIMASNSSFVSTKVFADKVKLQREADRVLSWPELPENVIYAITRIQQRESLRYGTCWILYLTDREGNGVKVWSPYHLIADVKEKRSSTDRPYITSLGQEKIKDKTINKYDLVFQETEEMVHLFDHRNNDSPRQ